MSIETIGPKELKALPKFDFGTLEAPRVPWNAEELEKRAKTHLLIFTPKTFADGRAVTLNSLRELFGMDPSVSEPCMYNQDWYVKEDFAGSAVLDGGWHLIPKNVREDVRAKLPEEIEVALRNEQFPTAVTCAFTFFARWFHTGGEKIWKHDFLWCSDRDHNGDRIYVGRYEDPTGVNKNGFNIHRHLALRSSHSAAPEVV